MAGPNNAACASSPLEPDAAGFAGARSLVVVRSEVSTKKTGVTTKETRFYLSRQEPAERTPAQWHQLVRGHWAGVESRNHWRRDHLWREDGSRTDKLHALANPALLRNALLTLTPVHYPESSAQADPGTPPLRSRRLPARHPLTYDLKTKDRENPPGTAGSTLRGPMGERHFAMRGIENPPGTAGSTVRGRKARGDGRVPSATRG